MSVMDDIGSCGGGPGSAQYANGPCTDPMQQQLMTSSNKNGGGGAFVNMSIQHNGSTSNFSGGPYG